MKDEAHYLTEFMIRYGGSFVSALGQLYRQADADNQRRIREAWPEYWAEYRDLLKRYPRKWGRRDE